MVFLIEEFQRRPHQVATQMVAYVVLTGVMPPDTLPGYKAAVGQIRAVVAYIRTPNFMGYKTQMSLASNEHLDHVEWSVENAFKMLSTYKGPYPELRLPTRPEISTYDPKSIRVEGDAKGGSGGGMPKVVRKRKTYGRFSENPARVWAKR